MSTIVYNINKGYKIVTTKYFSSWFNNLNITHQAQIADRLRRIRDHKHFGNFRRLDKNLFELRWKNGTRVYYSHTINSIIILLIGGNKNDQKKDIKKARDLAKKHEELKTF